MRFLLDRTRAVAVLLAAGLLVLSGACAVDDDDGFSAPDTTSDTGVVPEVGDTTDRSDAADAADAFPSSYSELDLPPVTEEGPFNVGYRELQVKYQAEADRSDEKRELNLSIWYPTTDQDGFYPRYGNLLDREEVIKEATPAPIEEQPLFVFSHGNGGIAEQNWFMTEYFATRGWIVVSPDHTGNTFKSGTDINLEAAVYRPQDISAVIDRMTSLEEEHPLAGKLSGTIVMGGHSFGGYTTLANAGAEYAVDSLQQKCETGNVERDYCDTFNTEKRRELFREGFHDDRIDLAIPQAPAGAIIFEDGLEQLQVPTLLMTGGMDQTLPNEEEGDPIWEYMKGDEHRRLDIPKAGHFTYSNMCTIFGDLERVQDDGCGDQNIDPETAFPIINAYALAFARFHLWDDETAAKIANGEEYPGDPMYYEYIVGAD